MKYITLSFLDCPLCRYAEPEGRLPYAWLFKTYTHRIEGVCHQNIYYPASVLYSSILQVDTDVMYLLSPNGSIVRSKARLKRDFRQLGVSEADLRFVVSSNERKPPEFLQEALGV